MTALRPQSQGPITDETSTPPIESGLTFDRASLSHLPAIEQDLFEAYGQGLIQSLPFDRIHTAFESQASERPQAVAIEHQGDEISYGELNRRAGIAKISEATIVQLNRRTRAAEEWLRQEARRKRFSVG